MKRQLNSSTQMRLQNYLCKREVKTHRNRKLETSKTTQMRFQNYSCQREVKCIEIENSKTKTPKTTQMGFQNYLCKMGGENSRLLNE